MDFIVCMHKFQMEAVLMYINLRALVKLIQEA